MSACVAIYREVICMWHNRRWHTERIACASELRDDLPRALEIGYGDDTLTFILAGFVGETPTYRQS